MTQNEMLKIAYAKGVTAALEDAGMTKEAIPFLSPALKWLGKKAIGGISRLSPQAGRYAATIGKGTGKSMLMGGLFSGGMSALGAPEGERGSAFLSGFLPGALSFGGWHLAQQGARTALMGGARGIAGREGAAALRRAARTRWFSNKKLLRNTPERLLPRGTLLKEPPAPIFKQLMTPGQRMSALKAIGAKGYRSALPLGAGLAASGVIDQAFEPEVSTVPAAAIYHTGRQALGRGYGLTPQTQSYPNNYGYYGQYY
jgi:hypothetical protein